MLKNCEIKSCTIRYKSIQCAYFQSNQLSIIKIKHHLVYLKITWWIDKLTDLILSIKEKVWAYQYQMLKITSILQKQNLRRNLACLTLHLFWFINPKLKTKIELKEGSYGISFCLKLIHLRLNCPVNIDEHVMEWMRVQVGVLN